MMSSNETWERLQNVPEEHETSSKGSIRGWVSIVSSANKALTWITWRSMNKKLKKNGDLPNFHWGNRTKKK